MLSWSKNTIHKQIKVKVLSLIISLKRVSFPSPFYLRAGMALEGCMVLPLFLFFMATLLYSLEIVRFQSNAYEAMHQAGSRACFYAYESKYGNGKDSSVVNESAVAESIRQHLEEQLLPCLCVEGGREGVYVTVNSENQEKGMVEIDVTYIVKPFIRWLPIGDVETHDRFLGHGFVGYTKESGWEEGEAETYVYITPFGSKYHLSQECTYLKVQIKAAPFEAVDTLRNESGGRYYPCEFCKPLGKSLVYLTEWGNRYHGESNCPALKRTVYIIPLSEAGTRTPCSKCG